MNSFKYSSIFMSFKLATFKELYVFEIFETISRRTYKFNSVNNLEKFKDMYDVYRRLYRGGANFSIFYINQLMIFVADYPEIVDDLIIVQKMASKNFNLTIKPINYIKNSLEREAPMLKTRDEMKNYLRSVSSTELYCCYSSEYTLKRVLNVSQQLSIPIPMKELRELVNEMMALSFNNLQENMQLRVFKQLLTDLHIRFIHLPTKSPELSPYSLGIYLLFTRIKCIQ